VHFLWL